MTSADRDLIPTHSAWRAHGLARNLDTLLEHGRLILGCVVATCAVALIFVGIAHHKYQAAAQMLVEPVPADDSTLLGLPVVHATSDPTSDVLTASALMTNTQVATAVVQALHLSESPGALLQSVQAIPDGQSNLVTIQATAASASEAQAVANEFANQVVATRAAALKAAVAGILPGLRAQLASLPPADRSGPGTVGAQILQLQQIQASGDPTITLASPASLPSGPSSPKTKLVLAAGLVGGLILGIGAAFAVDALDPRLRREQQLRELFDVPVLTSIPREHRRRARPLLPGDLSVGAAEGFLRLRTMVAARGGVPRAILVTGSSAAEGKTTTAINLAVALAQGGSHVILIEADLRRPSIAALLELTGGIGTEAVLEGEVDLEEALTPMATDDALVAVLPVRGSSEHLADRLSFATARRVVERAKEVADFVVIDSPPLTAVIDALPFAEAADDVLVVARIGSSKLTKLSDLYDLLVDQRSAPSGFVLIGASIPRRKGDRRYYTSRQGREPAVEVGTPAAEVGTPAAEAGTPAGHS